MTILECARRIRITKHMTPALDICHDDHQRFHDDERNPIQSRKLELGPTAQSRRAGCVQMREAGGSSLASISVR